MSLIPSSARPMRLLALASLTCLAGFASAQQLVLPDNQNLGTTIAAVTVWRTTLGHFQVAYDTSHFTNAGVTGPIQITRLRFRGKDGQADLGGHVYTGVSVQLGNCAVDYAAMSTTFLTNRGAMGIAGTTNVTVLPVSGGIPNDYAVDIDLVAIGADFIYDPTLGSDLLVDISFPAPVPTTNLVPFSIGSATASVARARMVSSGTAAALTGTATGPATMLVDFVGTGGYSSWTPARSERYGVGCAESGLASFYQDFQFGDSFDLANTSFLLTPDSVTAPTSYVVTMGNTPPDVTKVNAAPNSIADDAVVTHALGFTFNYPTGSTTTIKPSTNGFVWLDSTMTLVDNSPTVAELLGITANLTARIAPLWYDFHAGRNTTTHPNSGLHVLTDTSGGPGNNVCYVTWLNVGVFNQTPAAGSSVNTLQCVFSEATGTMEMRLGAIQATTLTLGVTGWSPGRVAGLASKHPGPRDLSHEMPMVTQPDGLAHALTHNTTGRAILGSSFTLQAFNQPTGTVLGAIVYNFVPQQPALSILPLAPGCGISVSLAGLNTLEVFLAPVGTVTSAPITIPAGFMFLPVCTQYAALDGLGNVFTSNALKLTAGLN